MSKSGRASVTLKRQSHVTLDACEPLDQSYVTYFAMCPFCLRKKKQQKETPFPSLFLSTRALFPVIHTPSTK